MTYIACIECSFECSSANHHAHKRKPTPDNARDTVEAACKYKFYLERQEKEMDAWRRNRNLRIPIDVVYRWVYGSCGVFVGGESPGRPFFCYFLPPPSSQA